MFRIIIIITDAACPRGQIPPVPPRPLRTSPTLDTIAHKAHVRVLLLPSLPPAILSHVRRLPVDWNWLVVGIPNKSYRRSCPPNYNLEHCVLFRLPGGRVGDYRSHPIYKKISRGGHAHNVVRCAVAGLGWCCLKQPTTSFPKNIMPHYVILLQTILVFFVWTQLDCNF